MTRTSPTLLTLLDWLDQRTPAWDAWRESSPEAARRAAQLLEVHRKLDAGEWLGEPRGTNPELVAAYLDGVLASAEAAQLESACWEHRSNLAEVVSEWRFRRAGIVVAPSRKLSERLSAMVASSEASPLPPSLSAVPPPPSPPVISPNEVDTSKSLVAVMPLTVDSSRNSRHGIGARSTGRFARRSRRFENWRVVTAALAVLIVGTLGWAAWSTRRTDGTSRPSPGVAGGGHVPNETPLSSQGSGQSIDDRKLHSPDSKTSQDAPRIASDGPNKRSNPAGESANQDPETPDAMRPRRRPTVGGVNGPLQVVERPEKAPERRPGSGLGDPLRDPPAAKFAHIPVRSELGLLFARHAGSATWQASGDELSLDKPLEFASLDDSWSTAAIPEVGTLVWQGASSGRLRTTDDGMLQIELDRGHLGVQNLAAGARIDVRTPGARFRATGVGDYSTLAVVQDTQGAAAYVPSGIIAIGETTVNSRQAVRWSDGVASGPQSWEGASTQSSEPTFDPGWLQMPDERSRRDWRSLNGKLVERLRGSSDVAATLAELRSQTRDGRQAALLARWNLAIAADPGSELWDMLHDRLEAVRAAGVERLLQSAPRELRESAVYQRLRESTDEATARRVLEWTFASRRNTTLNANLAWELVDSLQHRELAVRQVSVSLLERAAAPAFQQTRRKPPAYDASGAVSKRQAAQLEWRQIVVQLYSSRRN